MATRSSDATASLRRVCAAGSEVLVFLRRFRRWVCVLCDAVCMACASGLRRRQRLANQEVSLRSTQGLIGVAEG